MNRVRQRAAWGKEQGGPKRKAESQSPWAWAGLWLLLCCCLSARANVYATDLQINGSLQAGVVVPGAPLTISYILNENASHVWVRIYAGTNVAKTFSSESGAAGTNAGFNALLWDGTNDLGSAAAEGVYHVSVTAAADGYETWTNITDDGTNFEVFYPTSITVNKNTNSPFYGRVFVGNGESGGGMANGLLKYNADGSPADEGLVDNSGYNWNGGGYPEPSPWKMGVGSDDRLYVDNWSGQGVVVSFDQLLSTNYFEVLRSDNYPYPMVSLTGLSVCGTGTNMQIYMADYNTAVQGGMGILCWTFDSGGVIASNDLGTVDVTLTNGSDFTLSPYAVAVGAEGYIYTIQDVQTDADLPSALNDTNPKVLCFPPAPIDGPPDTTSIWNIGSGSPMLVNCYGVAVNAPSTLLAVASRGYGCNTCGDSLRDGALSVLSPVDGHLIAQFTSDAAGNTNQQFVDVAWDNVGNLYALDAYDQVGSSSLSFWRVYSPPGSNQATTVAVPYIQAYHALKPPRLTLPTAVMGQLNFILSGQSNVTYMIEQSTDLMNWTPIATNFSSTAVQTISVMPGDMQDFYRAAACP